ncbi:MAG: spermidine synthase [Deltaproteobacteria bacterium]|nr:spermidine synthase [Deltaproteobacteria bacterium]
MGATLRNVQLTYEDVDRGDTPLGEVTLRRYATDDGRIGYEIRLGGNFLMATHGHHSESAMARLAWDRLARREAISVLVGGLGAGYTLRAALDLPGVRSVTVVEIAPKVVEWGRTWFRETNGGALDDPRARVVVADLAEHLGMSKDAYDLALLDVDNGPGWLAAQGNERLYTADGIREAIAALRPGGVLAVWSPSPNDVFRARFREVLPLAEEVSTDAIGREVGEPGDVVYLGVRP